MPETDVTTTETVVIKPVAQEVPETPEQWLEKQPDEIKAKFAQFTGGLKGALDKERIAASEGAKAKKRLEELEAKEQERINAQLSKEERLQKERDEAIAKAEKAEQEASAKLLRSAALLKAGELQFKNPADAVTLARAEGLLSNIPLTEVGEFDEKAIEAALKPLVGRLPTKQAGSGIGSAILPPGNLPQPDATKKPARSTGRY